jgi:hypothetical protein
MAWIDIPRVREKWRALVNTVINLRVAENNGKLLRNCTTVSFSRRVQHHKVISYELEGMVTLWSKSYAAHNAFC